MSTAPMFQNIKPVDANTLSFTLSPTRVGYSNSLVRSIKSHVRTVGFRADMTEYGSTSDVIIHKNSTPMSNEMLADRIGLLLVHVENVDAWDRDKYLFKLHVVNNSPEIRHVTASDFEVLEKKGARRSADEEEEDENANGEEKKGEDGERVKVPNTRFFRPDPVSQQTCLIATLKPFVEGQPPEEIHIEAFASVGIGRDHVRFSPVCIAAYGYTLDMSPEKVSARWITWLRENKNIDPKDLAKDEEKRKEFEKEFRSMEIYRSYLMDEQGEPYSYDWKVESAGVLHPSVCVYRGCLAMAELCQKYSDLASGDLPDTVEIRPADARLKGYDIIFQHEDYTLGNALQTWIDDAMVATGEKGVTFVGFKVPHPLRDEGVLRIGMEDPSETAVREVLAAAATGLAEMFTRWAGEWEAGEASAYLSAPRKLWDVHAEAKEEEKKQERRGAVEVKKVGESRAKLVRPTGAARPGPLPLQPGEEAAAGAPQLPVVIKKKA